MAIEDDNPVRKNLTVVSTAIIVFYFSGGSLKNNELSLEMINVQFENVEFLKGFIWVMLNWFLFRYFLEVYKDFKTDYFDQVHNEIFYLTNMKKYIWKRYENKIRESDPTIQYVSQLRYTADCDERGDRTLQILVDYIRQSKSSANEAVSLRIRLIGIEKIMHIIPTTLWLTLTKSKITTVYPPILLAIFANSLLIYHYLPCYISFICG